ncbi:MAG: sigma-70 family RNA polymerase sigma factor [Bacteroidota bacterium]
MADSEFDSILIACGKNDRRAQKVLYQRYYSYGMSVCSRYVTNKEDATSILNEGFLKVFKNIKKFDAQYDFKPWLKTIMVNTAINHVKKMKKYNVEIGLDQAQAIPTSSDILSRLNYEELVNMIQSLSLAYRTVFNMYVIDGFKHDEIATKLGITASTSKSNLTRAKAKLREMIQHKLTA